LPGGAGAARSVPLAMRGSNVVRAAVAGGGGVRLVTAGVLRLGKRGAELTSRLLSLSQQFAALVRELRPDEVAVEEAFYGKSVQAALRIGEARGVVLAESARSGLDVHQYPPARVKRCVTGHGAARKESVASMLGQMLPELAATVATGLPADATDAVAVAWTRLEERRSPLVAAARGARPSSGRSLGDA
ncbi:MAG: crossover junction endodeoxyribonuclease RuvC, partial [Planctomycetes bacterium]|nr:crossover junction endodeoxyribonuclease RuvC [Planctomycetota bacterium]